MDKSNEGPEEGTPEVVFTGELFEASYIKGMLEDNGIAVWVEDEHMSNIAPWYLGSGGSNLLKIVVSSFDVDRALELIDSHANNEEEGPE